ncbi:hypothetical protein KY308_02200 [Candidatus Woesearchaeota archaeon]|nr:hypothetical protein [Candidatus Woesearchaeota archaeon]
MEKIAKEFDDTNLLALSFDCEFQLRMHPSRAIHRVAGYIATADDTPKWLKLVFKHKAKTVVGKSVEIVPLDREFDGKSVYDLSLKDLKKISESKYYSHLEMIYFMRKELKLRV